MFLPRRFFCCLSFASGIKQNSIAFGVRFMGWGLCQCRPVALTLHVCVCVCVCVCVRVRMAGAMWRVVAVSVAVYVCPCSRVFVCPSISEFACQSLSLRVCECVLLRGCVESMFQFDGGDCDLALIHIMLCCLMTGRSPSYRCHVIKEISAGIEPRSHRYPQI